MDGQSSISLPASAELANLHAQRGALPELGGDHVAAAEEFESLIATMLVKEMRQSLSEGFFGSGPGSDTFAGWLDKEIGENLSRSWQLDLAGMVKTNLDTKQARLDGPREGNDE